MKKKISILGSTGSIGLTTLKIIEKKKSLFEINLLSANKNFKLISEQIKKHKPKIFVINDKNTLKRIQKKFKKRKILLTSNYKKLNLKVKSNITISSIPGIAGLLPTISMMKFSKKILIANKESIICGWHLINGLAKKNKIEIIPIDSEHYSIYKLLENHAINEIDKIYITASGGPLLNFKNRSLKKIKPKEVLKHPKWKMGKKISIDSSNLMNKILELIEAQKIFNLPENKIDILVHPNSLVHAIIQFKNGLTKLLFHDTNMLIPISNAIFENKINIKDFYKPKIKFQNKEIKLVFKKVNRKIFPLIKIKKQANKYPSSGIIVNAVNEVMVDKFLNKKVSFLSINKSIFAIMRDRNYLKYAVKKPKSLTEILSIDQWARETTIKILGKKNYYGKN